MMFASLMRSFVVSVSFAWLGGEAVLGGGGAFTGLHVALKSCLYLAINGPHSAWGRFSLRWLGAHFLTVTIDFLCARVGGTFG